MVRIEMSAHTFARSRFAICPVTEVVGSLRNRNRRRPAPHIAQRRARAAADVPPASLDLLHGLVPYDHPYTPDFLTPTPRGPYWTVDEAADAVRRTPDDEVQYHLDIPFRGRPVRREVAATFSNTATYERWRRPMPAAVEEALQDGPAALAARAADALVDYFTAVLQPEWDLVHALLTDDVSHRAERMADHGAEAVINDLGAGVSWRDGEIHLDRPYDTVVDWATEGFLLMPSTADDTVLFSAERPRTPVLTYPARGISRLWTTPAQPVDPAIGELLGETRALLLAHLDEPRSTTQLSRDTAMAPATVSYHLGILRRAGLVRSRRRKRAVLYQRAPLGDRLLGK